MADFYFKVSSEEYGIEVFGPYVSENEARAAIANIQHEALQDRFERFYTVPYRKTD